MGERSEQDVLHLLNHAFLSLDERRYKAFAEPFVPDGCWHRQRRLLRDRAAITAALAGRSDAMRIGHVITNGIADATAAERAEARCVMIAHRYEESTVVQFSARIAELAAMARVRAARTNGGRHEGHPEQ